MGGTIVSEIQLENGRGKNDQDVGVPFQNWLIFLETETVMSVISAEPTDSFFYSLFEGNGAGTE